MPRTRRRFWEQVEPKSKGVTISVTLGVPFSVGECIIKWPMLTAASLIGSLPTIILYLFLQRYYVEGLARGAVKG